MRNFIKLYLVAISGFILVDFSERYRKIWCEMKWDNVIGLPKKKILLFGSMQEECETLMSETKEQLDFSNCVKMHMISTVSRLLSFVLPSCFVFCAL